jgi:hypothetical protein
MRIKEGVGFAVLYDSTTDTVFGPLFKGEYEVEDFLDWLEAGRSRWALAETMWGRDLRPFASTDIALWFDHYRREVEDGRWPEEDKAA